MPKLSGKISLVTGASRGIGQAVAKHFAAEGAHVVITARTVGGLEETDDAIRAAGGTCTIVPLDLRDFDKIDSLAAEIYKRFGKLDILVGNAGVLGELTPVTHASDAMWQQVMDVNVIANFRLIRAMDPLLRISGSGRAMFVTSGVTNRDMPSPYWGAYAASKVALEELVLTYAAESEITGVKVNLIDPGVVRTKMRATAMPGEDPLSLPEPDTITDSFVESARPECKKHAETILASKKK